jgi:uncharacterized protein YbbC (DUF1343 family)
MKYFLILIILTVNSQLAFSAPKEKVKLGIDQILDNDFEIFRGKRIAILSNNAGRASNGKLTVELFIKSGKCDVKAIFAPEHGFKTWVSAGKHVPHDTLFGLIVYSLYGSNRRPLRYQLDNIDLVVVDLQDIGIRSYTYISSVFNMMDACAEWGVPVIILDRPNPLGGMVVDGNVVEKGLESFVGIIPVSYIHGCTIGELCQMINEEGWLPKDKYGTPRKCNLSIVPIANWERWMVWEDTEIRWTPTSPNIPTVNAVRGCAVTGVFGELGLFQISLGVEFPFQYVGKIDFDNIEPLISNLKMPGIVLEPVFNKFTSGLKLKFEYDNSFQPYSSGFIIFSELKKYQPQMFDKSSVKPERKAMFVKVTGTKKLYEAIFNGSTTDEILEIAHTGLSEYTEIRNKYLLY